MLKPVGSPAGAPARNLRGLRVTVMGLGRFGGGAGVTRWLVGQGALVTVTDLVGEAALADQLEQIRGLDNVTLRLGGHDEADFAGADLVVANPAVKHPWDNPYLGAARERGVEVTTEIALLIERLPCRERVIGVTGTAGKSTTVTMIHRGLQAGLAEGAGVGGRVHLGGNIGGTLLGAAIGPGDWVVLELSSAQLHWLAGFSPGLAVVTGFAPNHVDWHGSVEHYRAAKQSLPANQRPGNRALLGPGAEDWPLAPGVERIERLGPPPGVRAPGRHNAENAAIARSVCAAALGRDFPQCGRAIAAFEGLPHRLKLIAEIGGVRFYDDSKCTTPEGCVLALGALTGARIHLIAGGYDKGVSFGGAFSEATAGVHALYAVGQTAGEIAAASRAGHTIACGTIERAVGEIAGCVRAGDVVLLSPACASWDQFANYVERGERFAELVRERFGGTM